MASFLLSIQRLVKDTEKRISKFIMAKACACLYLLKMIMLDALSLTAQKMKIGHIYWRNP